MSLLLLLVLVCPLMMLFMMRGMHGGHGATPDGGHAHGAGGGCGHDDAGTDSNTSLDELRRQREQLDEQIEAREADELTPVGGGWR